MRSETQKVVSMTMEKELHAAIQDRAKELNITVSGYIRLLVNNDLRSGGDVTLLAPPQDSSPTVDESAHKLARKAALEAIERVRGKKRVGSR
tara:strand:- start:3051 stop:3326 length:276 start_codon:yes stop_codon:yes gene_type:complete